MKKAILISAIAILSFILGCEKVEMTNKQQVQKDPTIDKILSFVEKTKNPSLVKSGETMSIDSAVWYIEAALNYEYCVVTDTSEKFMDSKVDSIVVNNITNQNLLVNDVINYYNQISKDVNKQLKSIPDEHKRVSIIDGTFQNNKFVFYSMFLYGQEQKLDFIYGDWHWGGYYNANNQLVPQGKCDWTYVFEKDASTEIRRVIRTELNRGPQPVFGIWTDVSEIVKWWNPDETDWYLFVRNDNPYPIWRDENAGGNPALNKSDFWVGFSSSPPQTYYPCINQTELNWYKDATWHALNQIRQNLIPTGYGFKDFHFWGDGKGTNSTYYFHYLKVYYGKFHKVTIE